MKFLIQKAIVGICCLNTSWAVDLGLLSSNTWESTDGKKLKAVMISATQEQITLKRDLDGAIFTLALDKLSETSKTKITAATIEIEKMAKEARVGKSFKGFSDSDEGTWELANRLGKVSLLLDTVKNAAAWGIGANAKIVSITPQKFTRVSDNEAIVHGEYICLRIQIANSSGSITNLGKLSVAGENLIAIQPSGEKIAITERKSLFVPKLRVEGTLDNSIERLGTAEQLVIKVTHFYR